MIIIFTKLEMYIDRYVQEPDIYCCDAQYIAVYEPMELHDWNVDGVS